MNYFKNLTLKEIINLLLEGKYSLSEVTKTHPETLDSIIKEFHKLGYYTVKKGCKMKSVINIKAAADYFIKKHLKFVLNYIIIQLFIQIENMKIL